MASTRSASAGPGNDARWSSWIWSRSSASSARMVHGGASVVGKVMRANAARGGPSTDLLRGPPSESALELGGDAHRPSVAKPHPDPVGGQLGRQRVVRFAKDLGPAGAPCTVDLLRQRRDEYDLAVRHRPVVRH